MKFSFLNRFTCSKKQLPLMIKKIEKKNWSVILDYTNENNKNHEKNFRELMELIETFPKQHIAIKLSSLNINNNVMLRKDINTLIRKSIDNKSKIYIDAENYKIQDKINNISNELMSQYNKEQVNVYKTYQMYRKDYFNILKKDLLMKRNYNLGIKLVRGAYYNQDIKYNILHKNIEDTHTSYNNSIKMFAKHYQNKDHLLCATHNEDSIILAKYLIDNNQLNNISFSQLLGMSDNLSFKLAHNYKVYKYLPYGEFKDTIPYLTRRLYENYPMLIYFFN